MPLQKYCCGICGKCCPKEYLKHGKMKERMSWLRRHYRLKHPQKFREMYKR